MVLQETRLGKLINDLRKKTKDEDLAKRAKKLLRNWQKLIDPQQPEVLPKEFSSTLASVVGSNWPRSLPVSTSPQPVTDNDKKPVLHSIHSSSTEMFYPNKHTSKQKVQKSMTSLKGTKRSALSTASGASGGSGGPEDHQIHTSGNKPHFTSPEPNATTILKKSVLQQQGQRDITAVKKVMHKAHNHCTNSSPRSVKQLVPGKQPTSFSATESEPLSALPLHFPVEGMHTECHQSKDPAHPENELLLNGERTLEQINNPHNKSKGLTRLQLGLLSEVTNMETEKDNKPSDGKKRKHQVRDYVVNAEGRSSDDVCKPARLKKRKLTFDSLTLQIRPSAVNQTEELHNPAADVNELANRKQSPSESSPSTLHKMNWKDMSQNEIVKCYLNFQNNLVKTSGSQVTGAHFFLNNDLKCEKDNIREASKNYVQTQNVTDTNILPGIGRDVTTEDVHKINNEHWPGVNGCYDSQGQWYGWKECISLDTLGDGSRLHILPYVCIE